MATDTSRQNILGIGNTLMSLRWLALLLVFSEKAGLQQLLQDNYGYSVFIFNKFYPSLPWAANI